MPVNQRKMKVREISYLSFRPPELGQPSWSILPLVVAAIGVKVSNLKVQVSQRPDPSKQPKPLKSTSTFSEDEIRTRAYYIYESRDRTNNNPDEDWIQAETELMDLVGGK